MPLADARSATRLPTAFAASMLAPVLKLSRISFSSEEADASVRPFASSITCGVADVSPHLRGPPQRAISNCRHLALPSLLFAFLAEDVLVGILDALALIGLGLAEGANLGRDVTDLLAVDAADDDLSRLRH